MSLTVRDLAVISLYTEIVLVEGEDLKYMYDVLEKLEGRPVYTHEIPDLADKYKDEIKEMVRDIYERAKVSDNLEKTVQDDAYKIQMAWKNLLTDPPEPAKGPCGLCDNCECEKE